METKNLIHEITGDEEWEHGLLLSYQAETRTFFERELLPTIKISKNLTLCIDRIKYQEELNSDSPAPIYVGSKYNYDCIGLGHGGRFHPKLYLFASKDKCRFTIGSANITGSGFKHNLEILQSFEIGEEDIPGNSICSLFAGLGDFLSRTFLTGRFPVSRTLRDSVSLIISETILSKIIDKGDAYPDQEYWFISSIEKSVLDTVLDIAGAPVVSIQAISPFFDNDLGILHEIQKQTNSIELFIPNNNSTFPKKNITEVDKKWFEENPPSGVNAEALGRQRNIHAKMYRFQTDKQAFRLVTSANLTSYGFGKSSRQGNVEIGVLHAESGEVSFINGAGIDCAKTTINGLKVSTIGTKEVVRPATYQNGCSLVGAKAEGSKIYLDLENNEKAYLESQNAMLVLYPEKIIAPVVFIESDVYAELQAPIDQITSRQVAIEYGEGVSTNSVYLSWSSVLNSNLPSFTASDFEKCRQIGGEEGIKRAIEIAKASGREDWLALLLSLDLSGIFWPTAEALREQEPLEPRLMDKPEKHIKAPNVDRLRRNLQFLVDLSDHLFLNHLASFFDEFKCRAIGCDNEARLLIFDHSIEATMPMLIPIIDHFRQSFMAQEEFKGLGYPQYRRLEVLRNAEQYIFLFGRYLEWTGHIFEGTDTGLILCDALSIKWLCAIDIWKRMISGVFQEAILEDKNGFCPKLYAISSANMGKSCANGELKIDQFTSGDSIEKWYRSAGLEFPEWLKQ